MMTDENIESVYRAVSLLQSNGFDVSCVEFDSGTGIKLEIETNKNYKPEEKLNSQRLNA